MSMSRRRLPTWTGDALHLKMPHPEHMAKPYAEHVELFDLVERGEAASAVDLLEHHIRYKGKSFLAGAGDHAQVALAKDLGTVGVKAC